MKSYTIYYTLLLLTLLVTGCEKDYLSFDVSEGVSQEEDVWGNDRYSRSVLNVAYNGLQPRFDLGDGALLAHASDEAVCSNLNNSVNIINNGTWGPLRTFDDRYNALYTALRNTNLFLEKATSSAITPVTDIPGLMGQAYFLRAFYHFELFKRYGRIVLATRTFKPSEELNLPRNTVDEVVAQIKSDCDSATLLIPVVWTGTGNTATDGSNWDAANRGRATKAAAMALKSRLLLYYASPFYNPQNIKQRWQDAADAALEVIQLNKHTLLTGADYRNLWNYTSTSTLFNREIIFATSAPAVNTIERNNAPIGYTGGLGRTNPTQELVDAFDMSNGTERLAPGSTYSDSNPYANRDARLGFFIVVNGSTFRTGSITRPTEIFDGGQDNILDNINRTKTGYYMRKFLHESASFNLPTGNVNIRRPWVFFRYAEILLNYAEALNEAQGPVADVFTHLNAVRRRANPSFPLLAGLDEENVRRRIRNERRVELCFEEHRFFDVRRWKEGEDTFNKAVHGMQIVKTGTTLSYNRFLVENRLFTEKNYLYPISQTELNRAPRLEQNPLY
jgi:hypothetical protein